MSSVSAYNDSGGNCGWQANYKPARKITPLLIVQSYAQACTVVCLLCNKRYYLFRPDSNDLRKIR